MLSHAFRDHYGTAVLIAGDGDYIPLIEEVKRCGKRVCVGFFGGDLGLAPGMPLVADYFVDLSSLFVSEWSKRLVVLEKAKGRQ